MKKWQFLALVAIAGAGLAGVAAAQSINAAGATFPNPIYTRWFEEFRKLHLSVQINYQSLGSGAGIKQLTEGTVDFGASDMPMTPEQIAAMKIKPLHFPTVLGGVVLAYNLPGVTQGLKLTPETLSAIYLGKIVKWNDPALAKDNPGVKLPAKEIIVVARADGSGTTFVFTDYLSKVSPEWKTKVGSSTSVKWQVGVTGKLNDGVAGMVQQTPMSIGYVELLYALNNKMAYAELKNSSGVFLKASIDSVTAAAAGAAKNMPPDFRVSITDAPGKDAYPISTFTYLLIPSHIEDAAKRKAVVDFLKWMLTDGQKDCAALSYSPLPKEVVAQETKQIAKVQ